MNTDLIGVSELRPHLSDAGWCVVDCRHDLEYFEAGRHQYALGHIPGAVFAHMEDDLSGEKTGRNGRHPLPRPEALATLFRSWGIDNDTQIVAYDASGGAFAARLWWLARWLGHPTVAVLDGGWPAWLAATNLSSRQAAQRPTGRFEIRPSLAPAVDAQQVQAMLGRAGKLVVDARAAERYEGRVEPLDPVAGHIPGTINRPWQANLDNGRFKPRDLLRREFTALLDGRAPSELTVLCGSGVTACHHLLALEHAGLGGAALYPGSWSEWVADPSRPVATGPQPG
ncbi:MAG: sulfurtransferase [Burkholderiales bacterium]|jgi:thiosulfate/3-mercaptopyruvate sulfurtransferase|nr:sulfurtransferase [Burkholderiales bacterium]